MRVFIGSTSESMELVNNVAITLDQTQGGVDFQAVPWGERVFAPSGYTLRDLIEVGSTCDFAVLLATGDDVTISRGATTSAPRDNVLLEIGLFIGLIGLERTFVAVPQGTELKLPSDLNGLTTVPYPTRDVDTTATHARFIVSGITHQMRKLGLRSASTAAGTTPALASDEATRAERDRVIEHLQRNAEAQGWRWNLRGNVLRLRSPRQKAFSKVLSDDPGEALIQLTQLGRTLRAHGVRVHNAALRTR